MINIAAKTYLTCSKHAVTFRYCSVTHPPAARLGSWRGGLQDIPPVRWVGCLQLISPAVGGGCSSGTGPCLGLEWRCSSSAAYLWLNTTKLIRDWFLLPVESVKTCFGCLLLALALVCPLRWWVFLANRQDFDSLHFKSSRAAGYLQGIPQILKPFSFLVAFSWPNDWANHMSEYPGTCTEDTDSACFL